MIGPATPPALSSRTVALADSPDLVELVSRPDLGVASGVWIRQREGMIGWGCAARIDTCGPSRFVEADRWWIRAAGEAGIDDRVRRPGTGPLAFGSFAFSDESGAGATLMVPSVVIGRRDGQAWLTRTVDSRVTPEHEARAFLDGPSELALPGPLSLPGPPSPTVPTTFADGALSGPQWSQAVAEAVARIGTGALDKVVLARDLYALTGAPIELGTVLRQLAEQYERTWVFHVDGLLGATPEMLVRLERGLVTSRVLAGTIRRTGDDHRDLASAASLARSSKDLEEHEYAVRSVAQALAPHCTSMAVPESPFVVHLPNVMHLASDVAGRLRNGVTSLGLAAALHPSAAVCGTPRAAAQELIAELEGMDRGRYAGPVGWTDAAGDGEWGIALRCGAIDPDDPRRMRLFAGCGIVAGSDPQAELAESDAKLIPMRTVLAG